MNNKYKIAIMRASGPIENEYLKTKLSKLNYEVLNFPIMEVQKIYNKTLNINETDIVFTTSFYGVYFLSKLCLEKKFTLFTLGNSAKLLANDLGYKNIIECNGDSANMLKSFLKLKKKKFINEKGDIIYAGAKEISFNLPARLHELGFKVDRYRLYNTQFVKNFNNKFIELVKKRKVAWIVLLSVKGAKCYNKLSKKVFNKEDEANIKFICISSKVAEALCKNSDIKFFPQYPGIKHIKKIIVNNGVNYGS